MMTVSGVGLIAALTFKASITSTKAIQTSEPSAALEKMGSVRPFAAISMNDCSADKAA